MTGAAPTPWRVAGKQLAPGAGGQDTLPWEQGSARRTIPAFKGPSGNALGWKSRIAVDANSKRCSARSE
jgi:hypothetical protein